MDEQAPKRVKRNEDDGDEQDGDGMAINSNTTRGAGQGTYHNGSNQTCEACLTKGHATHHCARPSSQGDTVIEPFHRLSPVYSHLFAQHKKPGWRLHTLNGPPGPEGLDECNSVMLLALNAMFQKMVLDRIGQPPLRVTDRRFCFIRLTLEVGEKNGNRLPAVMRGRWPLLKSDCVRLPVVQKLRMFEELAPEERPRSSLDAMGFQEVRRLYNAGQIPRQIFPLDGVVAPRTDRHSPDGGDYDLGLLADQEEQGHQDSVGEENTDEALNLDEASNKGRMQTREVGVQTEVEDVVDAQMRRIQTRDMGTQTENDDVVEANMHQLQTQDAVVQTEKDDLVDNENTNADEAVQSEGQEGACGNNPWGSLGRWFGVP